MQFPFLVLRGTKASWNLFTISWAKAIWPNEKPQEKSGPSLLFLPNKSNQIEWTFILQTQVKTQKKKTKATIITQAKNP